MLQIILSSHHVSLNACQHWFWQVEMVENSVEMIALMFCKLAGGTRLQLKPGTTPPGLSNGSQAGLTNGHVQHVHKRTTNVQQMPGMCLTLNFSTANHDYNRLNQFYQPTKLLLLGMKCVFKHPR